MEKQRQLQYFRCEYVAMFAQDLRRPEAGLLWSTKAIPGTTTTILQYRGGKIPSLAFLYQTFEEVSSS
jgi:hypothetical protein